MVFSQMPWEMFAEQTLPKYRERFRAVHGREAPPVLTVDLLICDADAGRAEALARRHMAAYYVEVMRHYEIMSEHFTYDPPAGIVGQRLEHGDAHLFRHEGKLATEAAPTSQ
jgi:hypothetical protein